MGMVECPSGLKVEVRGLKGKEAKLLEDRQSQKDGTFVAKILSACVNNVEDRGPYSQEAIPGQLIDWDRVLVGDRLFLLLAVRSATFGPTFEFDVQCSSCRSKIPWKVALSDLPVKRLGAADFEAVRSGSGLMTTLSDGKRVSFRLATGADERWIAKNKDQHEALLTMIALRVVSIDGVQDIKGYLSEGSFAEMTHLLSEFDKRDCGVETSLDVECINCQEVQSVTLPLGRRFWLPG